MCNIDKHVRVWNAQAINVPEFWYIFCLGETRVWVQLNRQEWPCWSLFHDLSVLLVLSSSVMLNYSKRYLCTLVSLELSWYLLFLCLTFLSMFSYISMLICIPSLTKITSFLMKSTIHPLYSLGTKINSIIPPSQLYFKYSISHGITISI